MKHVIIVMAVCLLSGCAITPIKVAPMPVLASSTDGMAISDQRHVDLKLHLANNPDPATMVGDLWQLKNGTAAQLVASIAATKYPGATVRVIDCWVEQRSEFIRFVATARVAAEIKPDGKASFTVRGDGRNVFENLNDRNMEIALERAFADFAAHLP
jgi:hypothetical protein